MSSRPAGRSVFADTVGKVNEVWTRHEGADMYLCLYVCIQELSNVTPENSYSKLPRLLRLEI